MRLSVVDDDRLRQLRLEVRSRRLSERHRQLCQMDLFQRRLLASVWHDLRTPLTAIKAYAEMCLEFKKLNPDTVCSHLRVIQDQADKLHQMIGNLLDLSQLQERRHPRRVGPVHLENVARNLRETFAASAGRAGVAFDVALADPELAVQADVVGLTRVLENLVSNAMKFTPHGSVRVTIERWHHQAPLPEVITWNGTPAVLFIVQDTGEGMSPRQCRLLFSHSNGPQRPRHGPGFGLGLRICREIVRQHGGRIWATSERGRGSQFRVLWPIRQPARPALRAPSMDAVGAVETIDLET
jgi:signal transduction histidine kinase